MITLKSEQEIEKMRCAGRIVRLVHTQLQKKIVPGVRLCELDTLAERLIRAEGATPSFKGYKGFPGTICASVDEELVHGIPDKRKLRNRQIVSIDIGACYEGYHGDSAWTYVVGDKPDEDVERLLQTTEAALQMGIKEARVGKRLGDISAAVEACALEEGFSIIREYAGHGIGSCLHEEPAIPNYGHAGQGMMLRPGMTFCVEPMFSLGERFVETKADGWTVVMEDGKQCAHFEHTLLVNQEGLPEILTS
ncbi:MAG: hypothetical protein RLZ12_339 [Bacillota bacterium]|jgi:methionyl aminopeptidase